MPLHYDITRMTPDLRSEQIALESAEASLQRINDIKAQVQNDGFVDKETLEEIQGLCPENVEINLPLAEYDSTDSDVVLEKTVVALEFIGTAITLIFLAIFIRFLLKVRKFMNEVWAGFDSLLKGASSPVETLKKATGNMGIVSEFAAEIQSAFRTDPDTMQALSQELVRLAHNERESRGLQLAKNIPLAGGRIDASADALFISLTQGKISRLIYSLVTDASGANNYKKFFSDYNVAMQARLDQGNRLIAELGRMLQSRDEFDAKLFKIDDDCFDKACKALSAPLDSQVRTDMEKAARVRDAVNNILQNKDSNIALKMADVYGVTYDFNKLGDVSDKVIKEINEMQRESEKLEKLNQKGMEETTYRKEATAYLTDFINATVSMSMTVVVIQKHMVEYANLINQASARLLNSMLKLESIIMSSTKLSEDEKEVLKALIQKHKKKYDDYNRGLSSIV